MGSVLDDIDPGDNLAWLKRTRVVADKPVSSEMRSETYENTDELYEAGGIDSTCISA